MPDFPAYVILGRGRRAAKMQSILESEGRRVVAFGETRRRTDETELAYKSRLSAAMAATGAQVAWLCVPPGPHIPRMLEAAIDTGLHAVVEKPWLCSRSQTDSLGALARTRHVLVGVDYEFCLLEEVEAWRLRYCADEGLLFGGRFTKSGDDRLGIPAEVNLGSHLLAIRAYAVPRSGLSEIQCGYRQAPDRRVWLDSRGKRIAEISFLGNNEPLTQRFIERFESALDRGEFPFSLDFAWRVTGAVGAAKC